MQHQEYTERMMMAKDTAMQQRRNRQREIAAFIRATLRTTGRPPSYAMIRQRFGYADNTGVRQIILRMEAKGLLTRKGQGRERRIQMVRVR